MTNSFSFPASSNNQQVVAYQGRPTSLVEKIMKKSVGDGSNYNYDNQNITFILWLFDNDMHREELLADWMVSRLYEAQALDNVTNGGRSKRPNMRAACKEALSAMNKHEDNCPIVLPKLTFNLFSHYMTTRKDRKGELLDKSSYGQVRSALAHLYKNSKHEKSAEFEKDLSIFVGGLKRTVTDEKRKSGKAMDSGKKQMSFEVYKLLCHHLYKGKGDDYLFAHCMLTMEWNLMARSENCFSMNVNHIQWRGDCLIFFFGKSKTNQTGERSEDPWHVYANPHNPEICPVLAMAKYLLGNTSLLQGDCQLFPGSSQYNRFLKIFHKVIASDVEGFKSLGVNPGDLGCHSARKGAITMCSSGCTVSPPMASICLRACWSMGSVKDRYIHYEKAGDQYVGRTVTGISSMSKDFAVSPPYFDFTDNEEMKPFLKQVIYANTFMGDKAIEELVTFLFASICFHFTHLDSCLHSHNKVRTSPLFIIARENERLRQLAVVRYPWNQTQYTPYLTGIPPHVVMMAEIERLKNDLQQQTQDIIASVRNELDNRRVGGDLYETSKILEEIKEKLGNIVTNTSSMVDHHNVNNNVNQHGITENSDVFYIGGDSNDDTDVLFDDDDNVDDNVVAQASANKKPNILISWDNCKEGKINLLPSNYTFPKMSFPNMLTMWFCGDKGNNIPPFKLLKSSDVSHMRSEKGKKRIVGPCYLSNMKTLVEHVEKAAMIEGCSDLYRKCQLRHSTKDVLDLYAAVKKYFAFPRESNGKRRRLETMSWKSYYNIMSKRKGALLIT